MNFNAGYDTRYRPVSLKNESTPVAAVFPVTLPSALLAPAPHRKGSLLQSDDDDEEFEEEEDFVQRGHGHHRTAPIFSRPGPNSEEAVNIKLVCNNTWLIQKPSGDTTSTGYLL